MSMAPPKWAKRVRFTSDDGKTDAGPKLLWLTLWGCAPKERALDHNGENREPVRVWPKRQTLADELGESINTIKGWLKRCKAQGWVRRVGNAWELAVIEPFASPLEVSANPGECQPSLVQTRQGGEYQPKQRVGTHPGEGLCQPPEGEKKKQGRSSEGAGCARADRELGTAIAELRESEVARRPCETVAQQPRLAAEQPANCELSHPSNRAQLSPEVLQAVYEAGALWVRELDTQRSNGMPSWADDLAGAVLRLNLAPADVLTVLRAWDAAAERIGALEAETMPNRGGSMPPRRGVWWEHWWPWVRDQLRPKPETPARRGNASPWLRDPCEDLTPRRSPEVLPC